MEAIEGKFNIKSTVKKVKAAREELKKAREEFEKAKKMDREASEPILRDCHHVRKIHELFCKSAGVGDRMTVNERKMFIFIVQYLYDPRTFFGYCLPNGLRRELVKVLRLGCFSVISRHVSCTLHEYRFYSQFRNDVNRIFADVVDGLVECGVIDPEKMK